MLDRHLLPKLRTPLNAIATYLEHRHVTANQVTLFGFFIGITALPLLAFHAYFLALIIILINRLLDGVDGNLARRQGATDAGGFLDIGLDFIFYSSIPFGFILANPTQNAIAGAFLIYAFIGTGSSFLAFSSLAGKHQLKSPHYPQKSFYYLSGITEGTETLICFVLCCLFSTDFSVIAYIFGALCWITTFNRLFFGFNTLNKFKKISNHDNSACTNREDRSGILKKEEL
jgi:phosphatidylglycerophosphate synthase